MYKELRVRILSWGIVVSAVLIVVVPSFAAADDSDLSGIWRNYGGPAIGGGLRSLWPAEAPYTEEGRRRIAEYNALVEGTGMTAGAFCVGSGMPGALLSSGGYPMEIIQRPEQITIIYELHNETRRIYLPESEVEINESDLWPTRNGYSRGRWEGDTLIVETTHLKSGVDQRSPHSEQAIIIERYYLDGEDGSGRRLLTAEVTVVDPVFYSEPVTLEKNWVAADPDVRMMLYECNEPTWEDYLQERHEALLIQ